MLLGSVANVNIHEYASGPESGIVKCFFLPTVSHAKLSQISHNSECTRCWSFCLKMVTSLKRYAGKNRLTLAMMCNCAGKRLPRYPHCCPRSF